MIFWKNLPFSYQCSKIWRKSKRKFRIFFRNSEKFSRKFGPILTRFLKNYEKYLHHGSRDDSSLTSICAHFHATSMHILFRPKMWFSKYFQCSPMWSKFEKKNNHMLRTLIWHNNNAKKSLTNSQKRDKITRQPFFFSYDMKIMII